MLQINDTDLNLQKFLDESYLPLMSATLVTTQNPKAAVSVLQNVYKKAINEPAESLSAAGLYNDILSDDPYQADMSGYFLNPRLSRDLKENISYPPGMRFPLEMPFYPEEASGSLLPGANSTVMDSVEKWVLYPLMLYEPDVEKKDIKIKFFNWLSHLVNEGKIVAILATWLGYQPENADAEEVLARIAEMTGDTTEHTRQIWQTQHELWQEFCGDITLNDALNLWLESNNIIKEEILQGSQVV